MEETSQHSSIEETQVDEGEALLVDCFICLQISSSVAFLNCCSHSFCVDCILKWAAIQNTCPLCKIRFKEVRCHSGCVVSTQKIAHKTRRVADAFDQREEEKEEPLHIDAAYLSQSTEEEFEEDCLSVILSVLICTIGP